MWAGAGRGTVSRVLSAEPTLWSPPRQLRRLMVVVAHPDDAEFGCAATVARLVDAGVAVRYVVMTDGASGTEDPTMTRERLAKVREAEQRAACETLGVDDVVFKRHPDGYLELGVALRREVVVELRRFRPEVVLTMNPEVRWTPRGTVNHPDHRVVGDTVLHAINPSASSRLWEPDLLDAGLEPWKPAEVWLMSFGAGNDLLDVTDTFDRKIAALRCHASQLGDWDPEPMVRQVAADRGATVGVPFAEPYTRLAFGEIADD